MNSETLISASIQGGIVVAAVWLLVKAMPSMPPVAKVWLWRLVFLKFAFGFVGIGNLPLRVLPAPPQQVVLVASADQPVTEITGSASTASETNVPNQFPWQLLWLSGVVAVSLYSAWRVGKTLGMVRRANPVEADWAYDELAMLVDKERIKSMPRLLESAETKTALLAWGLRPAIVLPTGLGDRADVRLMLAHEVAHLANRDLTWNLLSAIVKGIFFFHPLVWVSAGRAQIAQESAADQRAVRMTGASLKAYGDMLLRATVAGKPLHSIPGAVAVAGSIRALSERLDAMGRFAEKPPLAFRVAAFGVVAAFLPGYCFVAQAAPLVIYQEAAPTATTALQHTSVGKPLYAAQSGTKEIQGATTKWQTVPDVRPIFGKRPKGKGWIRLMTQEGKIGWVQIKTLSPPRGDRPFRVKKDRRISVPQVKDGRGKWVPLHAQRINTPSPKRVTPTWTAKPTKEWTPKSWVTAKDGKTWVTPTWVKTKDGKIWTTPKWTAKPGKTWITPSWVKTKSGTVGVKPGGAVQLSPSRPSAFVSEPTHGTVQRPVLTYTSPQVIRLAPGSITTRLKTFTSVAVPLKFRNHLKAGLMKPMPQFVTLSAVPVNLRFKSRYEYLKPTLQGTRKGNKGGTPPPAPSSKNGTPPAAPSGTPPIPGEAPTAPAQGAPGSIPQTAPRAGQPLPPSPGGIRGEPGLPLPTKGIGIPSAPKPKGTVPTLAPEGVTLPGAPPMPAQGVSTIPPPEPAGHPLKPAKKGKKTTHRPKHNG